MAAKRSVLVPVTAVAVMLTVFAGFARSFYLKPFAEPTEAAPLHLTLHGLVMTGWVLLFVTQAILGAQHRVKLHQRLGVLGAAWFVVVLVAGVVTTMRSAHGDVTDRPALEFMAIAMIDVVVFGGLTGAGLLLRKRPQVHRRLMLMGTLAMLPPAVGRLPFDFIRSGGNQAIFALILTFAAIFMVIDAVQLRRLHWAGAVGFLTIAVSLPFRLWLSTTDTWLRVATWLAAP